MLTETLNGSNMSKKLWVGKFGTQKDEMDNQKQTLNTIMILKILKMATKIVTKMEKSV